MTNIPTKAKSIKLVLIISLFNLSLCLKIQAQTDTVVVNNEKLACSVKEITQDAVMYTFPGEDVINSVYKNTVQKIIFKSGRVQTFAETTSYKSVSNVMDYENVSITSVESEVKGLYKIGEVSSKAKGTTTLSNQERVKDRAYRKFKIQAAMFGANIIYLANQRTEGNKIGYYFSSKAETNLTGIAYSNTLPNVEKFKSAIGSKTNFVVAETYELGASDSDVSQNFANQFFNIKNIISESGILFIDGNLQDEKNINRFQLANFNENSFSIAYKYKGTAYNVVIKF